jgi:hypothetical protein
MAAKEIKLNSLIFFMVLYLSGKDFLYSALIVDCHNSCRKS